MRKQVQDLMTANPATVTRTDSVVEAARLMESADVGSLPVVDGGTPIGIVTDRDIAIRVVAQARIRAGRPSARSRPARRTTRRRTRISTRRSS